MHCTARVRAYIPNDKFKSAAALFAFYFLYTPVRAREISLCRDKSARARASPFRGKSSTRAREAQLFYYYGDCILLVPLVFMQGALYANSCLAICGKRRAARAFSTIFRRKFQFFGLVITRCKYCMVHVNLLKLRLFPGNAIDWRIGTYIMGGRMLSLLVSRN